MGSHQGQMNMKHLDSELAAPAATKRPGSISRT